MCITINYQDFYKYLEFFQSNKKETAMHTNFFLVPDLLVFQLMKQRLTTIEKKKKVMISCDDFSMI